MHEKELLFTNFTNKNLQLFNNIKICIDTEVCRLICDQMMIKMDTKGPDRVQFGVTLLLEFLQSIISYCTNLEDTKINTFYFLFV